MSHVDEGLLHAYLDGAFAPGGAQGDEIEAHLESCTDCRARLEDARALRDRAADVLRHAAPADIGLPPFEALRARSPGAAQAGAPARAAGEARAATRRLARPQVRLAWAASVVLAIGAGWMANELVRRDGADFVAMQDSTAPIDADAGNARSAPADEATPGDGANLVGGQGEAPPTNRDAERAVALPDAPRASEAARAPDRAALDPAQATADREADREGALRAQEGAAQPAQADSPPQPAVAAARVRPAGEPAPLVRQADKLTDRDLQRRNDELQMDELAVVALEEIVVDTADTLRADTADTVYPRVRGRASGPIVSAAPVPGAPLADAASAEFTRTAYRPGDVIALDTLPRSLADGRAFVEHVALLNDYTAAASESLWSRAAIEWATAALGRAPAVFGGWHPATTETATVSGRVIVRQRYALEGGATLELIQRRAAAERPLAETLMLQDQAARLPQAGVPFKDLGESSPAFRGESVVAVTRPGVVLLLKGPLPQSRLHALALRIE